MALSPQFNPINGVLYCLVMASLAVGLMCYTASHSSSRRQAYDFPPAYGVNYLPYFAKKAGYYYLERDVALGKYKGGFVLQTDAGTVLDLRGHAITCTSPNTAESSGVLAHSRSNFILKNGTIARCQFGLNGVAVGPGSRNVTVRNILFRDNYFRAVMIEGQDALIERNVINTVMGGRIFENSFAIGIETKGPNNIIRSNTVYDVRGTGTGEGVGISVSENGAGTVIKDNTVTSSGIDDYTDYAYWVGESTGVRLIDNKGSNYIQGFAASTPTAGCLQGNSFTNNTTNVLINSLQWDKKKCPKTDRQ
ncbi:MAG: hypothetical protein KGQ41_02005 [Alphaproteobacteria bacterium]|nr:hypothetical protein [Alphaproteobacteria bacterium]